MTKQLLFLSALFTTLLLPVLAQAEIYKTIDANGNVTYSNVKLKGSKKLNLEPADTSFGTNAGNGAGNSAGANSETRRAPQAKTPTPASFPKVDSDTQNLRDGKRKTILQGELDAEKKALEDVGCATRVAPRSRGTGFRRSGSSRSCPSTRQRRVPVRRDPRAVRGSRTRGRPCYPMSCPSCRRPVGACPSRESPTSPSTGSRS